MPAGHSLVGRALAVELLERVARRVEDELDRVDERSVEIEEDRSVAEAAPLVRGCMAIGKLAASMHAHGFDQTGPFKSRRTREIKRLLLILVGVGRRARRRDHRALLRRCTFPIAR